MLHPSLILVAVLPLMLCGEAKAAGMGSEMPVTYAAYHSEWGDNLTPPIARSIHLELTRSKLNVSLSGGMPSLNYAGPVDAKTFDEIVVLLRSMDAASWPGCTGDENKGERRKDCCKWSLCVLGKEPNNREIRVYGADRGRDTSRLEAEARLCGYVRRKLSELYGSVPKKLERLSFSDRLEGGYWSVIADEGRVRVCVIANSQPDVEFYANQVLLQDIRSLLDKIGVEAWHGFGYGRYAPGTMPLCLEIAYSTRQRVTVMAEPGSMPEGFVEFCDALRDMLAPLARRWQKMGPALEGGIKHLRFGENGMRMEPHYELYRCLDAEGVRPHIMRAFGDIPDGDVPLSADEEQELAGILRSLASWDGFNGNARNVLDAPGFSFNVEFADGRRIRASGYGTFPKGYREGRNKILDFIEKRLPESLHGSRR